MRTVLRATWLKAAFVPMVFLSSVMVLSGCDSAQEAPVGKMGGAPVTPGIEQSQKEMADFQAKQAKPAKPASK